MSSKSLLVRIMREFGGGGHSIFAPSASARWIACSGSLIAGLFEHDETIYEAAEGTVAHGIAEQWLRTDVRPTHLIGTVETITEGGVSHDIPITRSMLDSVQEYVDWCRFEEGEMFTEIRVWFTDLMPRANPDEPDEDPIEFVAQGGTADNIIIRDRTLIVTDLKYGTGVQVFAEGNPPPFSAARTPSSRVLVFCCSASSCSKIPDIFFYSVKCLKGRVVLTG